MLSAEPLLGLAEIAIALAGFSAIVVVLKRGQSGSWKAADADRFHGMVVHAVCAVLFCLLPNLIDIVVQDAVTTLHICAALLGVQIILHAANVMRMPTTSNGARGALAFGIVIGFTQFAAFSDWGVNRELQFYVLGIIWHIIQAGVLFIMLVWIRDDDIKR